MAVPVGNPTSRDLQRGERQITRGEDSGNGSGGDVPLVDPPQQVDAVRNAFDAGDVVRRVKEKVSSIPGSIRGHGMRIAKSIAHR
jgi:hypothetical protein